MRSTLAGYIITQWAGLKEEVDFQVYSASVLLHKFEKHRNKFYYIETWGQCYKTFFVRYLRIFVIS
jgi:hypothetical protein